MTTQSTAIGTTTFTNENPLLFDIISSPLRVNPIVYCTILCGDAVRVEEMKVRMKQ